MKRKPDAVDINKTTTSESAPCDREEKEKPELMEAIYFQEKKVLCQEERYAVKIKQQFKKDYVKNGLKLAEKYTKEIMQKERGV